MATGKYQEASIVVTWIFAALLTIILAVVLIGGVFAMKSAKVDHKYKSGDEVIIKLLDRHVLIDYPWETEPLYRIHYYTNNGQIIRTDIYEYEITGLVDSHGMVQYNDGVSKKVQKTGETSGQAHVSNPRVELGATP